MKLKSLKSRWGIYLFLFYLLIAVFVLDIAAYAPREILRDIPYYIEDFFLSFAYGFGLLIDLVFQRHSLMSQSPILSLLFVLIVNFTFIYFIGFGLEKLYKRIRKRL
jgi:hypothetical protein